MNRRRLLAGAAAAALLPGPARAQSPIVPANPDAWLGRERHGLSAFGALKYAADFRHFEYVNPDAPVGGRLSFIGPAATITFDSFSGFILKGDHAQGLEYVHGSLMVPAYDEPDAVYGFVASSAVVAPDRLSATFRIRPEARFSDGSPVTADDAVFTFDAIKENGHPVYRLALRSVVKAEALATHTVRYTFTGRDVRDLPLNVALLPVLSRAYNKVQPFEQTTLRPPVGCGPYRIAGFEPGRHVTYERRADFWGWHLPVVRGHYNFQQLRYEYFADRGVALQNLLAGAIDLREEYTSRDWATAYDVPPVRDGRIVRLTLPSRSPVGAQGFYINTRREKFADPRVRRALDLAFNFEWTNRNLFFEIYERTVSYFENTDLKAEGAPGPDELALLEPFRASLPAEVFGPAYVPTPTDGTGSDRRNLREAAKLLEAAGFAFRNGQRVNAAGVVLDVEFLSTEQTSDRIIQPFASNLSLLGINARVRRVDPAQYERRRKSFDFDIMTARLTIPMTPGNEIFNYWTSRAADTEGSYNLAGIKSPVVDALVARVAEAHSRAELRAACRALDRVLRAGHYWISNWFKASHHLAFWDKYGRPAIPRPTDRGAVSPAWSDTWWLDPTKAATLAARRKGT